MIKTLKFTLVAALAIVVLWACNSGEAPKVVAEKFLKAYTAHDYAAAKELCTEDGKKVVETIEGMSLGLTQKTSPAEFEITSEEVNGDNATVGYKMKETGAENKISLVKQDGKWMVAVTKDQLPAGKQEEPTVDTTAVDTTATTEHKEEGHH